MVKITYEDKEISTYKDETVLSALLRNGFNIPNSCNAGACQTCVLIGKGDIPQEAQQGLKDSQKQLGQFKSCSCVPTSNLKIHMALPEEKYIATVFSKVFLSDDVVMLRLSKEFDYRAGQYITLYNPNGEGRCYSLASHSELDDYIELHIRVIESGTVSSWVATDVEVGEELKVSSPRGDCFYTSDENQPMFLSGIGTGFAPLYGILRDALYRGHKGKITILLGAKDGNGLYHHGLLPSLQNDQVSIHQVALDASSSESELCFQADIYDYAKGLKSNFTGASVYLCGAESFVHKMKKQCFLLGASMNDIHSDAFVYANLVEKETAAA